MAVIKLVEDYAVRSLRQDVRDALTLAGEQSVLLSLYHPDDPDAEPCRQCGDDVYKSPERDCPSCYGTMFEGGVRTAVKVWALYTDRQRTEQLSNRGVNDPDQRHVQFEGLPMVLEHDVLVRVSQWDAEGVAAQVEGYYLLNKVDRRSLRTGSRYGQDTWDVVGQKADLAEIPEHLKLITQYPVQGHQFSEGTQILPASPTLPARLVAQPDVKVIYFPYGAPSGPTPGGGGAVYVHNQSVPASVWTIVHNLGFNPDVSIVIDGEEAETDIDYPTTNVVVLTFGTPQAGTARLT